ncbi:DNA polymerase-4 [Paenibacillus shirakamiensis]|uniref:DNA polymerase IV n=1 Tax=Paenibacillus shirakamiensis TaxID=1265935 RepID=A0ABS4JCC0_9BACL|nr:DNA polymerase IV [Paenibacillus shirakamiensis]MBP1999370.1 DNA polymerase-4 [Paenibacillus shirakamiensis]
MTIHNTRTIFLADCQSFYASVEKADYPQYKDRPLAVAGDPSRRSGIILAACPLAKVHGVTTAETLGEALKKCPDLVIMRPRMQHYIDVSLQITQIYKQYTDLVEIFSIDEQFLDMTGSFGIFGNDPYRIAQDIQQKVLRETGVRVRVGMGPNKILAKAATDIWAKKNADGLFMLSEDKIKTHLWQEPIHKMFGVGSRMNRHFLQLGMVTIGDVANTPLPRLKEKFRARFGKQSDIHAEVMWRTANGVDSSPVTPETFQTAPKSVGHMMTLPKDYIHEDEINTVLLEITEEVCRDCRRKGYMGQVVSVSCMCSPYDAPTRFSRQMKIADPTNDTNTVFKAAKELFYRHWEQMPVRQIGVMLSSFAEDEQYQLTLFEDQVRIRALNEVTDIIKDRFGSAAIVRASSLTGSGQAMERTQKIGGHYK